MRSFRTGPLLVSIVLVLHVLDAPGQHAILIHKTTSFTGEVRGTSFVGSHEYNVESGHSSDGIAGRSVKYSDQWLRQYNLKTKKYELVFLRYALNDSSIGIFGIANKKVKILDGTTSLNPDRLCGISYGAPWYLSNFDLEIAITRNPEFSVVVEGKDQLLAALKVTADEVRSCTSTDGLLSGRRNVQLYRNGGHDPVAFFSGNFTNGVPDGYGMLIAPYTENGRAVHPNLRACANDPVFFVRAGIWRKGGLTEDASIKQLVNEAAMNILHDQFSTPTTQPYHLEIIQQYCVKDSMNPDYSNKADVVSKVSWTDTVSGNVRENWIWFRLETLDFYDTAPTVKILDLDPANKLTYEAAIAKENIGFTGGVFISVDRRYWVDDYTQIRQGGEYPTASDFYCSDYETRYDYNSIDLQIRKRKRRDAPLEFIGDYTIVDVWRSCEEAHRLSGSWFGGFGRLGNYHVLSPDGKGLIPWAEGETAAIAKILEQVRLEHPDPLNDTTLAPRTGDAAEKVQAVLHRLRTCPKYAFDPSDTLSGIWYQGKTEHPTRLMYIPLSGAKVYYHLDVSSIRLNRNYHANFEGEPFERVGSVLHKSYGYTFPLVSLTRDEVVFSDFRFTNLREVWKRLPMELP